MTMFNKKIIYIYSKLMVMVALYIFCPPQSSGALESPVQPGETQPVGLAQENPEPSPGEWEYVFEDRPDPFLPFIEPQVATKNIPDQEEEDIILTGMQLFEPGQLKLVAIMFSSKSKIAMVEDVTGKGYVINEGMLIGRYGVVSQITLDEVNITETRKVAGKDVVTPVVMRLNKEGDK